MSTERIGSCLQKVYLPTAENPTQQSDFTWVSLSGNSRLGRAVSQGYFSGLLQLGELWLMLSSYISLVHMAKGGKIAKGKKVHSLGSQR